MTNNFLITKASGQQELFNEQKLRTSLIRSGASANIIQKIVNDIYCLKPRTTKEIYRYALDILKKESIPIAARYNLKQALLNFGPAGYPFEKFIEKLYQKQGYQTEQGIIMQGKCVPHEVDVLAHKNNAYHIIECKFRNAQRIHNDVKVPLYVKSRTDDITIMLHHQDPVRTSTITIITNTKFTSMAVTYASCVNIELISWSYPVNHALSDLIRQYQLHPITAIPHLSHQQQKKLIEKGLVLCQQAPAFEYELRKLGFSATKTSQLIADAQATCTI